LPRNRCDEKCALRIIHAWIVEPQRGSGARYLSRRQKQFPNWEKTARAKARKPCGDLTRPWKGRSSTVVPAVHPFARNRPDDPYSPTIRTRAPHHRRMTPCTTVEEPRYAVPWKSGA
jgi:hypothetical protein